MLGPWVAQNRQQREHGLMMKLMKATRLEAEGPDQSVWILGFGIEDPGLQAEEVLFLQALAQRLRGAEVHLNQVCHGTLSCAAASSVLLSQSQIAGTRPRAKPASAVLIPSYHLPLAGCKIAEIADPPRQLPFESAIS